jgi:hypothetical protein
MARYLSRGRRRRRHIKDRLAIEGDDDIEAADFWSSPPSWIAVGPTPDQAVANLIAKTAPGIDRGPA